MLQLVCRVYKLSLASAGLNENSTV